MSNSLFPIFLKTEHLRFLVIGGGNVGLEKTETLLRQNPETKIKIVAKEFNQKLKTVLDENPHIQYFEKEFDETDLENIDLVIAATDDTELHKRIKTLANAKNILVNIADTPDLCDFYLGSIVKKGNLKIAISTNGKSPTVAKRLRETLEENIPDEMDEVLTNIHQLRNQLSGDFQKKVEILNKVTKNLSDNPKNLDSYLSYISQMEKSVEEVGKAKKILNRTLLIIGLVILILSGGILLNYFQLWDDISILLSKDNNLFYWMLLAGFAAEIVAGSMGMGYGVICTTILLSLNIAPPVVSASIHSAESFTSLAGSISHFKLKNVNKNMVKKLVIPALIGVVIGALLLTYVGEKHAKIVKPFLSLYTFYLGFKILQNALLKKEQIKNPKTKANFTLLGIAGGFIDSFTGGGWGPLVTGTLVKNGYTPRYVVGSSTVAKCILTVCSAIIFIFTIGISHWNIVAGLLLGGIFTAPFSAMLTSRLPPKRMFIFVGSVVMIMSLVTIYKSLFK